MAGLTEFYCGWNEPSHASQFKWLEYTFNRHNTVSNPQRILLQGNFYALLTLEFKVYV
jgi:hypothetical protein